MAKLKKLTEQDILLSAADIIETVGLAQRGWGGSRPKNCETGECVITAISKTAGFGEYLPAQIKATELVASYLFPDEDVNSLMFDQIRKVGVWSDKPERTQEEVCAMLRTVGGLTSGTGTGKVEV